MKRLKRVTLPQNPRGGTTLTEVLMSLLCMGIGVVAVASLFPIALLRSVQGTQLTSGTILRFNAETLIDLYDGVPAPTETLAANPDKYRNLMLNPDFDGIFNEHFRRKYLVDPLGAMIVRGDNGRPLPTTDKVGRMERFDALPIFYATPAYSDTSIPAADRPARAIVQAANLVTLPDSWVKLYDEIPTANTATEVTLPSPSVINNTEMDTMITNGTEMRLILFSSNGRISEARNLSNTSFDTAGTITWDTTKPLPSNGQYFPDNVERIRLEQKERRFTWMLTVRNDSRQNAASEVEARARVDVVIFFRRSPTLEEEIPYKVTLSGQNYTVSKLTTTEWNRLYPAPPASGGPPAPPYPDPYPDPFLKRGGFMLDTTDGEWHRLQKINDSVPSITLEKSTRTLGGHYVVFMKGVVDVFPLGSKP